MIRLRDLAVELGISRPTLYNWVKAGLPVYYIGSIPFFDRAEVEMWMRCGGNIKSKRGRKPKEVKKNERTE